MGSARVKTFSTMGTMEQSAEEKKFTVQSEIKIIESHNKKKEKKSWAFVVVVKWFSTLFMFSAILFCLVASKLSLVLISQRLNDYKKGDDSVAFLMLILIMMIPQFLAFFRSLASSAFSSKEYWPSKMAVFFWVYFFHLFFFVICSERWHDCDFFELLMHHFLIETQQYCFHMSICINLDRSFFYKVTSNVNFLEFPFVNTLFPCEHIFNVLDMAYLSSYLLIMTKIFRYSLTFAEIFTI